MCGCGKQGGWYALWTVSRGHAGPTSSKGVHAGCACMVCMHAPYGMCSWAHESAVRRVVAAFGADVLEHALLWEVERGWTAVRPAAQHMAAMSHQRCCRGAAA